MIDLREKALPNTITVDGEAYLIETDFRTWIKVGEMMYTSRPLSEYLFLFKEEVPIGDFSEELLEFYLNPNVTPRKNSGSSNSDERIFDYILDGEYIVGSFYSQYGIDLTSIEYMHWHLFKALFESLEEKTKIGQIIDYRSWTRSKKKYETIREELKRIWRLPKRKKQLSQKDIDEINAYFGSGWENE